MLRSKEDLSEELEYLKRDLDQVQEKMKTDSSQKNLQLSQVLTGKYNLIASELKQLVEVG